MPKKPFTDEEVTQQRERIMQSAAKIMADIGYHHLSMRVLAKELNMAASNIYNYFADKEQLFLAARQRGFDLLLQAIKNPLSEQLGSYPSLTGFALAVVHFAQDYAGFYQLMFQPPKIGLEELNAGQKQVQQQTERQLDEWQHHVLLLLTDALPGLEQASIEKRQQAALYFLSALHGLIDVYHHQSFPALLNNLDLIADSFVASQLEQILSGLTLIATAA